MKVEIKNLTTISFIPVRRVSFLQGMTEMAVRNVQLVQRIERGKWQIDLIGAGNE